MNAYYYEIEDEVKVKVEVENYIYYKSKLFNTFANKKDIQLGWFIIKYCLLFPKDVKIIKRW